MLFSAHLVDTGAVTALRRKTPQGVDVPGLRVGSHCNVRALHAWGVARPQLRLEAMLACWDDEAALERFLESHPTGLALAPGWHVRMELVRAAGVWPGLDDDMVAAAGSKARSMTGPSVAITIGTAHLTTLVPFMRVNSGLGAQFLDTPSGLWGTAMTNLPERLVATLTIWESAEAALDYMRSGAHGAAVDDHYDPAKDPTGHTFVTGGGFFGFRPLSTSGSIGGRNPLPADLVTSRL